MQWTYHIPHKMGTSLLLMGVLVLVLFNNLNERSNSTKLKTAFESIYEDRLMAESYILRLADELHQIQELLENPASTKKELLTEKLGNIEQINLLYLNTKLTPAEETHFVHFENLTWELTNSLQVGKFEMANSKIDAALRDLNLLSEIQVSEAHTLLAQTNRIFSAGSISSQFEIGLVILIGLMIQGILFASKSLQAPKTYSAENLN